MNSLSILLIMMTNVVGLRKGCSAMTDQESLKLTQVAAGTDVPGL